MIKNLNQISQDLKEQLLKNAMEKESERRLQSIQIKLNNSSGDTNNLDMSQKVDIYNAALHKLSELLEDIGDPQVDFDSCNGNIAVETLARFGAEYQNEDNICLKLYKMYTVAYLLIWQQQRYIEALHLLKQIDELGLLIGEIRSDVPFILIKCLGKDYNFEDIEIKQFTQKFLPKEF